jgi:hypothetical protein
MLVGRNRIQQLEQTRNLMIRELNSQANGIGDPAQNDLASGPRSISLSHLFD